MNTAYVWTAIIVGIVTIAAAVIQTLVIVIKLAGKWAVMETRIDGIGQDVTELKKSTDIRLTYLERKSNAVRSS